MLSAMQNSTILTILAISIALAASAIPASAAVTSKSSSLSTQSPALNSMFKQIENSVVQINSKIPINNTMNSRPQNATALGSGFVYDKQGHILLMIM
jgi:S1-C subfamily serine protease